MILTRNFVKSKGQENLTESYTYFTNAIKFDSNKQYDIFLSHSYNDKEIVYGLIRLFEQNGFKTYVDWKDDSQLDRDKVTKNTANILRNRMKNCKSLLYIATENIENSKWCPWELGYFDGKKDKCAILPVLRNQQDDYTGQEYLGLYPYIDYHEDKSGNKQFWVNNSKNEYVSLQGWLNGEKPSKH